MLDQPLAMPHTNDVARPWNITSKLVCHENRLGRRALRRAVSLQEPRGEHRTSAARVVEPMGPTHGLQLIATQSPKELAKANRPGANERFDLALFGARRRHVDRERTRQIEETSLGKLGQQRSSGRGHAWHDTRDDPQPWRQSTDSSRRPEVNVRLPAMTALAEESRHSWRCPRAKSRHLWRDLRGARQIPRTNRSRACDQQEALADVAARARHIGTGVLEYLAAYAESQAYFGLSKPSNARILGGIRVMTAPPPQ